MRRLLAVLPLVLLVGCGGGDRITQTREVAPFERLDVSDSVDVEVVPGDAREVKVYAGEDVMDRVETESSDGVLHIDLRDRGIVIGPDPLGDVRVQVSTPSLQGVSVGGSGDVKLENLDLEQLDIAIEGAGDLQASGTAERLNATIEGAGDARLFDLAVRSARVVVEGAADAELNVSEDLDVSIKGAGDVTYRGEPTIRSDVEGAGEIRRSP